MPVGGPPEEPPDTLALFSLPSPALGPIAQPHRHQHWPHPLAPSSLALGRIPHPSPSLGLIPLQSPALGPSPTSGQTISIRHSFSPYSSSSQCLSSVSLLSAPVLSAPFLSAPLSQSISSQCLSSQTGRGSILAVNNGDHFKVHWCAFEGVHSSSSVQNASSARGASKWCTSAVDHSGAFECTRFEDIRVHSKRRSGRRPSGRQRPKRGSAPEEEAGGAAEPPPAPARPCAAPPWSLRSSARSRGLSRPSSLGLLSRPSSLGLWPHLCPSDL